MENHWTEAILRKCRGDDSVSTNEAKMRLIIEVFSSIELTKSTVLLYSFSITTFQLFQILSVFLELCASITKISKS